MVTEVTLNHEFLMSSLYTDSERSLARLAIEAHPGNDLRVLIGGLGLGYTAHESLQSNRVSRVDVVELLAPVIDWLESDLMPLSPALQNEPRLFVRQGDIFHRLASPPVDLFDVILIDVDHSPEERLAGDQGDFYSTKGLRAARKHLSSHGVLGVWSFAESPPFLSALQEVFEIVEVRPITYDNRMVDEQPTDWLFFARDAR